MAADQFLLRIDDKDIRFKEILRNLSSQKSYEENEYNFTCVVLNNNVYYLNKPTHPYSSPLSAASLFGIIFLTSSVVLVLGICCGWFAIIYYRQCRQHRMKKKLRQALAKSTQQMLAKSPVITFDLNNKDEFLDDDPMCAICLESFKDQEKIRKLSKSTTKFCLLKISSFLNSLFTLFSYNMYRSMVIISSKLSTL
jgi:hypothetical protein